MADVRLDDRGDVGESIVARNGVKADVGTIALVGRTQVKEAVVNRTVIEEGACRILWQEQQEGRRHEGVIPCVLRHEAQREAGGVEHTALGFTCDLSGGDDDARTDAGRRLDVGKVVGQGLEQAVVVGRADVVVLDHLAGVAEGDGVAHQGVVLGALGSTIIDEQARFSHLYHRAGTIVGGDVKTGEETVEGVLRGEAGGPSHGLVVEGLPERLRQGDPQVASVNRDRLIAARRGVVEIADRGVVTEAWEVGEAIDACTEDGLHVGVILRVEASVGRPHRLTVEGIDTGTHGDAGVARPVVKAKAEDDGVDAAVVRCVRESEPLHAIELAEVVVLDLPEGGVVQVAEHTVAGPQIERIDADGGSRHLEGVAVDRVTVAVGQRGGAHLGQVVATGRAKGKPPHKEQGGQDPEVASHFFFRIVW